MKLILIPFIILSVSVKAQYSLKVKREDNRFLFFHFNSQNDTIIKNVNDNFYIKLPDSLKNDIRIFVYNGQLRKSINDSLYCLTPIKGMKYSHSIIDNSFKTLLEGPCEPSKSINIQIINTNTNKVLLKNTYIVK